MHSWVNRFRLGKRGTFSMLWCFQALLRKWLILQSSHRDQSPWCEAWKNQSGTKSSGASIKDISVPIFRDDHFTNVVGMRLTKPARAVRLVDVWAFLQGWVTCRGDLTLWDTLCHLESSGKNRALWLTNCPPPAPWEPPCWPNPASYSIMEGSLVSKIWSVRIQGMDISMGNWIRRPMVNSRKNSLNQSWERSQHCCRASGSMRERARVTHRKHRKILVLIFLPFILLSLY